MKGIFAPEKGVNVSERTTGAFPAFCLFLDLKIPGGRVPETIRMFYNAYNENKPKGNLMNDKQTAAAITTALFVGYSIGATVTRRKIFRELDQRKQLITNALSSAVNKALVRNMTEEEFEEELNAELEFIKIIDR